MLSLLLISLQLDVGLSLKAVPSSAEKRLLNDAVKTSVYFDHLQAIQQQCPRATETFIMPEFEQLNQTLTTQLHLSKPQLDSFINDNSELKALSNNLRSTNKIDCDETEHLQKLLDEYELALFAVEIATPLTQKLLSDTERNTQQNESKANELKKSFDKSTTIVIANIVPISALTSMDRARYLHLDYAGDYIYMIEQGWKHYTKLYIGMTSYIDDVTRAKTADKWLLFFDGKGNLTESMPYENIKHLLKSFDQPDWRFDLSGNLERKQ